MNKYLTHIESQQTKEASLIGGAVLTHLLQNVGVSTALKSKHIAKHLANAFSEGAHGVVNTSLKSKVGRAVMGAGMPDIAVAHKSMHDLGRSLRPILTVASRKQKAGMRMLTEGRFADLHKHGLHNDPMVRHVHQELQKHIKGLPSLENLVGEGGKKVSDLFKSKDHPLLSNITKNVSRGHKPEGKKFKEGQLTAKPIISGAVGSFLVDPAAGAMNTSKSLMASSKISENKYGKKAVDFLQKKFIHEPVEHGLHEGSGFVNNIKHKLYHFGLNPMSANLKRTSAALADAIKNKKS